MDKLNTPINIETTKDANVVTVTWEATNQPNVKEFEITFLNRSDHSIFKPSPNTVAAAPADGIKTRYTFSFTPTQPSSDLLKTTFLGRVIATPTEPPTNLASDPGLETFWDANLSLTIEVRSRTFTLTSSQADSSVYRLPVSETDPLTITAKEVMDFVADIGALAGIPLTVPTKFPDGSPISGTLNISKLAVDTKLRLFAMNVNIVIPSSFNPIPGLKFKEVGLAVLRTNGMDTL